MAEVIITAIMNRTKETITIPHQQRGPIEIEPGGSRRVQALKAPCKSSVNR